MLKYAVFPSHRKRARKPRTFQAGVHDILEHLHDPRIWCLYLPAYYNIWHGSRIRYLPDFLSERYLIFSAPPTQLLSQARRSLQGIEGILQFTLTLAGIACYTYNVPRGLIQGGKAPWHQPGERPRIGNPKGAFMRPMKKPIRLLGVVFQID